jgi:predicted TIM-barrel fold metal-dependent hydrolase
MRTTDAASGPAIVDAHHHLLDLRRIRYPWIEMKSPVLQDLLPNYYDAAHTYSPLDYRVDVNAEPISASVACEFGAADGVAEARWVQECAESFHVPSAFIGAAPLASAGLPDVLAQYRDLPVVRAVRQPLYWAADPLKRLAARGDYLVDPYWVRDFERVAETGLVWDLLVYDEQLPATHDLIRSFPATTFVLEAAGWPLDKSPLGFARWKERLQAVSEFSNVVLKLQGLALIFGTSREAIEPWVTSAVRIFGPARCMLASHYPVDKLLWGAQAMVGTIRTILSELSGAEQADFFGETARRVYRLDADK